MVYLPFLMKCIKNRFKFLIYPPAKKARFLVKNKMFFWAGHLYLQIEDYKNASLCFKNAKAHKALILCYQKLGLYSKAIEVADEQKYYQLGVKLCEEIENTKKAAYFYSYFKPLQAAKLYEKDGFFYEAGNCYLKAYEPLKSFSAFTACLDANKQQEGYRRLSEFGLGLFLAKQYEDAFKLFIELKDYYSALECARKLKENILIESVTLLIAADEAEQAHYVLAGKCAETVSSHQALLYYAKAGAHYDMIRLLIAEKDYGKAINICFLENNLELAYEIAQTYDYAIDLEALEA